MREKRCEKCLVKDGGKERRSYHRTYDEHRRNKTSRKFYQSSEWRAVRVTVLTRDNYLCVECLRRGVPIVARVVDHIIPLVDDWSLRLTLSNLQSLCQPCHTRKTNRERASMVRRCLVMP